MSRWTDYFMGMARHVSSLSKDPATKVGCVIATPAKAVVSTGFNGIPMGVRDRTERMERPAKYLWTSHAEENAVALAARNGHKLEGCVAYVTHHPCSRCARLLIQAGVKAVYIGDGTTAMPEDEFKVAAQMFEEAEVARVFT